MNHDAVIATLNASRQWVKNFNRGNVDYCVAAYTHDAVMQASPMGDFNGTAEIDDFWRPFVQSGATDLIYSRLNITQIDETRVQLSADWSMNIGRGIISLEEWVKQADNTWKLTIDHFEVKEQFSS